LNAISSLGESAATVRQHAGAAGAAAVADFVADFVADMRARERASYFPAQKAREPVFAKTQTNSCFLCFILFCLFFI
jgi:hypothetical protein